jgi:hypothetical protein
VEIANREQQRKFRPAKRTLSTRKLAAKGNAGLLFAVKNPAVSFFSPTLEEASDVFIGKKELIR